MNFNNFFKTSILIICISFIVQKTVTSASLPTQSACAYSCNEPEFCSSITSQTLTQLIFALYLSTIVQNDDYISKTNRCEVHELPPSGRDDIRYMPSMISFANEIMYYKSVLTPPITASSFESFPSQFKLKLTQSLVDIFIFFSSIACISNDDRQQLKGIVHLFFLQEKPNYAASDEDIIKLIEVNKKILLSVFDLVKNAPSLYKSCIKKDWLRKNSHKELIYKLATTLKSLPDLPASLGLYIDDLFNNSYFHNGAWHPKEYFRVNKYMICKLAKICVDNKLRISFGNGYLMSHVRYFGDVDTIDIYWGNYGDKWASGIHPLLYKWNDIICAKLNNQKHRLWKKMFAKFYKIEASIGDDLVNIFQKLTNLHFDSTEHDVNLIYKNMCDHFSNVYKPFFVQQ